MKKFILCIAAVSAITFGSFAQNNNSVQNKGEKPAIEKKEMKPFADSKAFEGINLTADQKTKLNNLAEESRKNMQKAGRDEQKGPKGKDMKKGDSQKQKLSAEEMKQKKEEMKQKKQERAAEMKADKRKMLDGIKAILTPQQYTTFLENNWLAGGKGQMKQKMHKGDRQGCGKDGKKMAKGGKKHGKGGKMAKGDNKMKGQKGNRSAQGEKKTTAAA